MFGSKNYRIKSECISHITYEIQNNFNKDIKVSGKDFSKLYEEIESKIFRNFKDKGLKLLSEIRPQLNYAFDYINNFYAYQNGINTGKETQSLGYLYQLIRDKDMIQIIRDNCIEILIDHRFRVYLNLTKEFLMKTIDWSFQFSSFKGYHEQIKEDLLRSFHYELTDLAIKSLIIKHNRNKLSNIIEESYKNFNKDYNNTIKIYLDEWNKCNPLKSNQTLLSHLPEAKGRHLSLSQSNDTVIDIYKRHQNIKLKIRFCYSKINSDLIQDLIEKLFNILKLKYQEQLVNDLKIIVELVDEKIQREIEIFLNNDLYNQFKTRNLYKCLIEKIMERMEKIKKSIMKSPYSEFVNMEILDKHFLELKIRLEGHQDDILSKQRSLFEKFINVRKKCLNESIELYSNLRDENKWRYSDPELHEELREKAIQYADKLISSLKGDFTDNCYSKLSDDIKNNIIKELEQISIKCDEQATNSINQSKEIDQVIEQIANKTSISNTVSDQLKSKTFNRDGLSKYRLELESARSKLNFALRSGNISGVKRRAIDEQLINTKQLLNSNVMDHQKYQNQTKHLDDLLKLINK